jgi:8-oxo-dGTP diphosphatase
MPSTAPRRRAAIGWKDEMKTVIVTAGVIVQEAKVLVAQRRKDSPHGLLWEFPGGKVKEGEEPREALRRELKEELDIEAEVGKIFDAVFHPYPVYPILLLVYYCGIVKGVPKPLGSLRLKWVDLRELERLDMPPADGPICRHLASLEMNHGKGTEGKVC